MSDIFRQDEITLSADTPDGLITLNLPCHGMELEAIPKTDRWRWVIRVERTPQLDLADWDLLSFVDSEGFDRACSVRDVRERAPGVLTMTQA